MAANLGVSNPYGTTSGNGLFTDPSSGGLIQGMSYPEPGLRYQLRAGYLSPNETLPMWGGVAIYELIPGLANGPVVPLGPQMGRATSVTGGGFPIAGFSVFDQAYAMLLDVGAGAPMAPSYGQVNSYRMGSGMRIAVACDPGLAAIAGSPVNNAAVTWDFVNQQLVPFTGSIAVGVGNTYNSTTGLVTLVLAAPASPDLTPGDSVIVAGLTGTGSFAAANGTFTAAAGTTNSVLTYFIATGLTLTLNNSAGTITTGATQLAGVEVLNVDVGRSMTVNFNATTGQASWNYAGSCAVLRI